MKEVKMKEVLRFPKGINGSIDISIEGMRGNVLLKTYFDVDPKKMTNIRICCSEGTEIGGKNGLKIGFDEGENLCTIGNRYGTQKDCIIEINVPFGYSIGLLKAHLCAKSKLVHDGVLINKIDLIVHDDSYAEFLQDLHCDNLFVELSSGASFIGKGLFVHEYLVFNFLSRGKFTAGIIDANDARIINTGSGGIVCQSFVSDSLSYEGVIYSVFNTQKFKVAKMSATFYGEASFFAKECEVETANIMLRNRSQFNLLRGSISRLKLDAEITSIFKQGKVVIDSSIITSL